MARIDPLPVERIDPALRDVAAEAGERLPQFMNQILTLAHHPQIGRDLVTLYLNFQDGSVVKRRYIELAVLTVSYLNRCVYCVSHHTPLAKAAGLSDEALAELEHGPAPDSPHFDPVERLVIQYTRQMTQDARRVPDSLFAAPQLVELTVRIGLANFFNRLNDALKIDLEPGVDRLL